MKKNHPVYFPPKKAGRIASPWECTGSRIRNISVFCIGYFCISRPVVELDELVVLHPGGQLGKAEVVPVLH